MSTKLWFIYTLAMISFVLSFVPTFIWQRIALDLVTAALLLWFAYTPNTKDRT